MCSLEIRDLDRLTKQIVVWEAIKCEYPRSLHILLVGDGIWSSGWNWKLNVQRNTAAHELFAQSIAEVKVDLVQVSEQYWKKGLNHLAAWFMR